MTTAGPGDDGAIEDRRALLEPLRLEVAALERELERLSRLRGTAGPRGFKTGLIVGAILGIAGLVVFWLVVAEFFAHFPGG